ncbi:hypothetical protein CYMTET_43523 [Cymbomonas tetramitiformis]|uniref:Uncharacterized protein n=1 Tax=Cymbomonas tetramitiformis TaxID=36881 RepID=A0AAE0C216_9CHLO|nr:hypothetical protein CYMTET_43523 [Cymbomonas tetramitiformis]
MDVLSAAGAWDDVAGAQTNLFGGVSSSSSLSETPPRGGLLGGRSSSGSVEASTGGSDWGWVPRLSQDDWQQALSVATSGRESGKEEEPWAMSLTVVHSWQSHRKTLKTAIVTEDEALMMTAGGGGSSDPAVVRCWDLANGKLVLEYTGHKEMPVKLAMLDGGHEVASLDAGGAVHVWSANNAERLVRFTEGAVPVLMSQRDSSEEEERKNAGGFTCMALAGDGWDGHLIAGTADGQLRALHVDSARIMAPWGVLPASATKDAEALPHITSIIVGNSSSASGAAGARTPSRWLCVGLRSGDMSLLDGRSGAIQASWRAHDGPITCMHAVGQWGIVTGSQDKLLSVWDIRYLRQGYQPSMGTGPLVHTFKGHKDAISALMLHDSDVLSVAGARIGLASLQPPSPGATTSSADNTVKFKPMRLRNQRGNKETAAMADVGVLPHSRLFFVATEDGYVKICH